MPSVVGKQLDVAMSDVKRASIDEPEIVGGGVFGVVDESNWTVCKQEPSPGSDVTGTPRLIVDRECGTGSSSPSVSETSKPAAPSPSPSPVLKGKALIEAALDRPMKIFLEGRDMDVTFAMSDNFTNNMIRRGFYSDARDVLIAVKNSGLKVKRVTVWGTFSMQDRKGNSLGQVNVINLGFDDIREINLDNLYGEEDLTGASDVNFVHPAFRE